ncbi:DUF6015 family protein [Caldiplasma sukawensis]
MKVAQDTSKDGINLEKLNFVRIEELSDAIRKGLSLEKKKMTNEESFRSAEHLINFFGYSDRVIDNMLEPEDRDAFYTMEDLGILQTEREETTLFDGREWRIHYWILNVERVRFLVNMKIEKEDAGNNEEYLVYEEIPDDVWNAM